MSQRSFLLILFFSFGPAAAVFAAEPAQPRGLDYPKELRAFRAKALKSDGAFAPDIAFALRTCPKCGKPYVMGTFPRLKRQPFDSLAAVHQLLEKTCVKKAPFDTIYSARFGKQVPRACPVCDTPEEGALPDKVLFCHAFPENGDDMQIEYEVKDGHLVSRKFWRVPKEAFAAPVNLPDEGEDSIKRALGWHFSLRAVWNELFARGSREDLFSLEAPKTIYRQVSPGMSFIVRPHNVSAEQFKNFVDGQLQPDRDKGLFSRLDSPLKTSGDLDAGVGTYRDWAAEYAPALSNLSLECFVALSFPELHKAAREVLASRNLVLEAMPGEKNTDAGTGVISKGGFKTEISFGPLASLAVLGGLSLHHACAYFLTTPVFTVECAERLNRVFRALYPLCSFEVSGGRYLILRDKDLEERKLDLLALADKLDPDNRYMFELFCDFMIGWDKNRGRFGPRPKDRDVSPTGLPAFVERRIRPVGHLKAHNLPGALYEPREDRDGKGYDLCYTSECSVAVVYIDPARDRFKGMTLDEVRRLYDAAAGVLPMFVDAQDTLSLPGDPLARVAPCRVVLLCGLDLASLAADDGRAIALAEAADLRLHSEDRLHFYAFTTNSVALAQRKLAADERKLARARIKDLAVEAGLESGIELDLHFDLPHAEPRGKVLRRRK